MKTSVLLISFIFLFCCGFFIGYKFGGNDKQKEIKNRAKKIEKEYYTNKDIELIIFNESQL